MKAIICENCGNNVLTMDPSGNFAICEHCGTKYANETLKISIDLGGTVNVAGPVETVIGNAELERKYANFCQFIELKDKANAEKTLSELRYEFPSDARVWLATFKMAAAFKMEPSLEDVKRANTCGCGYAVINKACEEFISAHGHKLSLVRPSAPRARAFASNTEINDYYVLADGLEAYLLYKAKPLDDYLGYSSFGSFIKELTGQYVEGVKKGTICPIVKFFEEGNKIPVPQYVDACDWMTDDKHLERYICSMHGVNLEAPEHANGPMKMGNALVWGIKTTIGAWLIAGDYEGETIYRMKQCIVRDDVIEYRRKNHICIHCEAPMNRLFKYAECKVCGMPSYTRE